MHVCGFVFFLVLVGSVPQRSVIVALGYTGSVVLASVCLAVLVSTAKDSAIAGAIIVSLIWLIVVCVQFVMEWGMYPFLNEPRP